MITPKSSVFTVAFGPANCELPTELASPAQQVSCQILRLVLGPLDLNLLGLRVQLNQVTLLITAIPGGGLLGDLLCAIANLLSPSGTLAQLIQLVALLNQLIGLLG